MRGCVQSSIRLDLPKLEKKLCKTFRLIFFSTTTECLTPENRASSKLTAGVELGAGFPNFDTRHGWVRVESNTS